MVGRSALDQRGNWVARGVRKTGDGGVVIWIADLPAAVCASGEIKWIRVERVKTMNERVGARQANWAKIGTRAHSPSRESAKRGEVGQISRAGKLAQICRHMPWHSIETTP